MKIQKVVALVALVVLAMVVAACGGGGGNPTAAPSGASGTPEDTVKAFFTAVFTEENPDVANLLCAAVAEQAADMVAGFGSMKTTLEAAGGTLDISGLTYTKTSEEGDKATVEVAGKIKVTVAGTDTEQDFPAAPVPVTKEGDAWKVCA